MCQFESAVNHDVRTALNAIMGFAQILNLKNNTREEIQSYSGIICQQSQTLLDIINEMQKGFASGEKETNISEIQAGNCR